MPLSKPGPPPRKFLASSGSGNVEGLARDAAGNVEGYEIFIKYLPYDTQEDSLADFFSECGTIVGKPRLMRHAQSGQCKGIGWITFATEDAFRTALTWDGCTFGSRNLSLSAGKAAHTGVRPSLQAPGTHTPALFREVIRDVVGKETGGVYVDATFGRGGHTRGILSALSPSGSLHAFDLDPEAIAVGRKLEQEDPRFKIHHAPFSAMQSTLKPLGVELNGVLFDLGISSPQFDEAHRGFKLEADGPLDLRFDQSSGQPAHAWLQAAPRDEIIRVIAQYGETSDETSARRIADAICLARDAKTLPKRTREFAALVAAAKGIEYQSMHAAKLTFQALRIHLNEEFTECKRGMRAAFKLLKPDGRIGIIAWKHSESAIVVDFFRGLEAVRPEAPMHRWYMAQPHATPLRQRDALEMDDAVRPSQDELQTNSRSRSAVLHILRKRQASRVADLEAAAYPLLGWAVPTGAASEEKSGCRLKKAKKQRIEPAAEDAPKEKKQKKAKKD